MLHGVLPAEPSCRYETKLIAFLRQAVYVRLTRLIASPRLARNSQLLYSCASNFYKKCAYLVYEFLIRKLSDHLFSSGPVSSSSVAATSCTTLSVTHNDSIFASANAGPGSVSSSVANVDSK
jgi:hypothetical protein